MRNKSTSILFILILMVVSSCTVNHEQGPVPVQQGWSKNQIRQLVEEWRVKARVPGVVVGIFVPGKDKIIIASGMSNREDQTVLDGNDQFRIASITKTFIAAEVLKLAAQGQIHLDDPLSLYLPDTSYGDVVTIRHLLSHRSGYFDPIHDDPNFIPDLAEHMDRQWTWADMLKLAFQHDLFFVPGGSYRYANTNYMLLGLVIENITGKPLGEALASDLMIPLGLDHTLYTMPETDTSRTNLVPGYITHPLTGETIVSTSIPYGTIVSASADTMISNAADLLKWSHALYGKDALVLEPAFQEEMLTFDVMSSYGLGVFQFDTPIGKSFGHGGDTAGYLSLMEYIPDQDLSIVILTNADAPYINLSELRNSTLTILFQDSAKDHVDDLLVDLKSEDALTRKNTITALGQSNTKSPEVISSLIVILESDPVAENRKEAALALGLLSKNSEDAKQALRSALQDNDPAVREAAQLALSVGSEEIE